MLDLNMIKDQSIIICPANIKDALVELKSNKYIYKDIKFITKQELQKNTYFSYDVKAIHYIYTKYGYNYDLAEEILDNLHNIKPINKKTEKLVSIYEDLKVNKLLKFNHYYKYLFKNKTVYIYGYDKIDQELTAILSNLELSYTYLEESIIKSFTHSYYTFNTIEEEVSNLASKICSLVNNGISLNNIYIYNYPQEYELILNKVFNLHGIPYENKTKISLYDSPIYKNFIILLEDYNLVDAFNKLQVETIYDPFDTINQLVSILVEINGLQINNEEKLSLLNYLSKKTYLKNIEYKESIKLCDYNNILTDSDYVFILGFSLGSYPVIHKDKEFYLDNEKELLNRNTAKIKNTIEENKLINFISKTKNLYISFKKKQGKIVYYPSLLVGKLNIKEKTSSLDNIRYSDSFAKLEVAKYIDLNRLYGVKNKWMNTFDKNELNYNIYSNSFTGLDNYYNGDKLSLSYSSINEYNKCPFMYYVKRILKADEFVDNFNTLLGSLYHKALEESNTKQICLNEYEDIINKTFETYKERFFAKKLFPQVIDVIKKNHEFKNSTLHDNEIAEIEIEAQIDELTTVVGRIDKVMLDEVAKSLIVIDYKTGDFKFNKKKTQFGVEMQLPIYAYLLKQKYPEYSNIGMYIQNVCLDDNELLSNDKYSLDGITVNNLNRIITIDPTLGTLYDDNDELINKSIYIKHIKLKKDKTLSSSKNYLVDENTFDNLIATAKEQILNTVENIREGKFNISPIHFKNEQTSVCSYCSFSDICNRTNNDVRHIDLAESEDEDEI